MAGNGKFLNLKEVSQELGISYKSAWKWASSGLIPGCINVSPGRGKPTFRVSRVGLDKFLRERERTTAERVREKSGAGGGDGQVDNAGRV
ncbi:MAG TPA: helix-turn-helix domain-containing protein [bacterium]|nr:helix-turn-helix domain-containing protein [bacterium]